DQAVLARERLRHYHVDDGVSLQRTGRWMVELTPRDTESNRIRKAQHAVARDAHDDDASQPNEGIARLRHRCHRHKSASVSGSPYRRGARVSMLGIFPISNDTPRCHASQAKNALTTARMKIFRWRVSLIVHEFLGHRLSGPARRRFEQPTA